MTESPVVVAGALGECVHVAGVMNFLRLAENAGWQTVFLGPAVSIEQVIAAARAQNAAFVGVSYRLTPENGERLLAEFAEAADDLAAAGVRFAFGGTPPVAECARAIGFFEQVFDGSEPAEDVLAYLRGQPRTATLADYPQTTVGRIAWKTPYPLIRHHFGLPTLEATLTGIEQIADRACTRCDLVGDRPGCPGKLLPPRAARPAAQGRGWGAGANADDYRSLYVASRRGNFR